MTKQKREKDEKKIPDDMLVEGVIQQELTTLLESFREKFGIQIRHCRMWWSDVGRHIIHFKFEEDRKESDEKRRDSKHTAGSKASTSE